MNPAVSPHDQLLYLDQGLQIGRFWIPANDRGFADTGPIANHSLVFPTLPVEIRYSRAECVVADPVLAMCYNRGCEYRRRALNSRGDLCWWIAYEDTALSDAMGTSADRPFSRRWVLLPGDAFMVMRAIIAELNSGEKSDPVQLEECAWWLIDRCLENSHTVARASRHQERVVEKAREFLAEHFCEPISLSEIARNVDTSPFHLSRLFPRVVGKRLHQYLVDLRLRRSVEEIFQGSENLTDIALDLGFSTPSHFSTAFKKNFGISPSRLRKERRASWSTDIPSNFLKVTP